MLGSASIAGIEGLNMLIDQMGNQNTSGIVEKEQVSCPDYLEQENEIKTQQNSDAKATESDSCDAEVQENPPMESVAYDEKEAIDCYPSEDCETETNGLPNCRSKDEEVIEDNNQLSADLSNVSLEDVNITTSSSSQELRTLSHCEEKCETKLVQNRVSSVDFSIHDRVVANMEDVLVETETPSVEGESIEMSTRRENRDLSSNIENTENGISNEKGVEDRPKVEMGSSLNAPHDLRMVPKDTSALECDVKDEHLVLEERLTANKLSSGANTFHVDQTRAGEEVQGTNDVDQMVKEIGLVETKGSVPVDECREEERLTDETTIKEIGTLGDKSSALYKDRENETTTEECSSKVGYSLEVKKVNEPEREPEPGNLFSVQYSNDETNTLQVLKSNGVESTIEKFRAKSESSLEIKKVDEPARELEPGYALPKQYSINKTPPVQVIEPNGGDYIVERCKLKSKFLSEIKKVDEPETVHSLPEQNATNETSTVQVPELNGGENTKEKCRSTCESSLTMKKVSEPEPEIEPRHVFSEQHPDIEKSTLQIPIGPVRTLEKCRSKSESSFEIKESNESELVSKSECKPKADPDSKRMLAELYFNNETSTPQVPEYKEGQTIEKFNQLELRKSPSFDFGHPFDSRSEESDKTPLLYQDSTAPRRFSTCSGYSSPLHHEAVEVQEKTIRMERSTSDVSKFPFLNLLKEEKPENLAVDKDQENGLKSSLSTEDCDGISAKRNGKRKPRSSLFTTCICCTSSALS
ncbi:uncharacterized protein LOC142545039 isoform X2 [Primulina tabacum]|uniref:uncharacterized protein LOC142545039 isoform X2 n=1 Tax=Primulina tabacum TaxID=48773 RepID=UPI003F5ABACC